MKRTTGTLAPEERSALFEGMEASLSFLGLGAAASEPSWGGMLSDGRAYLTRAWWLATLPGLAIFAVVLAGPRLQTLPVTIFNVLTFEQINWGPLAAAALLVTAPVLILAMMVQRHIITGLAAGGLKG